MTKLFSKATLGPLTLQNHLVMSPMTRNRAMDNIPNALMAEEHQEHHGITHLKAPRQAKKAHP